MPSSGRLRLSCFPRHDPKRILLIITVMGVVDLLVGLASPVWLSSAVITTMLGLYFRGARRYCAAGGPAAHSKQLRASGTLSSPGRLRAETSLENMPGRQTTGRLSS